MACIECGASDRVPGATNTGEAEIASSTGVTVIASCAIRSNRIRANPGTRIACARDVALILCRACHWVARTTNTANAEIAYSTGIAIGAGGAVSSHRVGANARAGVASAGDMTLILCGAYHCVTGTGTVRAHITGCARVTVIASRAVRLVWIRANPRARIAGAGGMALIDRSTG
jgi:hypothetical protein